MKSREIYLARSEEELRTHLVNVAEMAASFASVMGGATVAHACGCLHDLGKYSPAFQEYIQRVINKQKTVRGETIHALQGGLYALEHFKDVGLADMIVNIVASHHGALLDMLGDEGRTSQERLAERKTRRGESLRELYRQAMSVPEAADLVGSLDERVLKTEFGTVFDRIKSARLGFFGLQLFVRMLYSCLVDADRCDAAGFDGRIREPQWGELETAVERHMAKFKSDSQLNRTRAKISRQCFEAGLRGCGVYTLSVPTGGGKTLSSLRFAIRHALQNHLKRVVYVIPYLSIIDQTAKELRSIFKSKADEWVLEHHSNVVLRSGKDDEEETERKVLTERWDRPIVVTTMVRFMETVLSNRASDLRKLHNMSETVFVFDEIQSLPIRCTYLFNMTINFLHQLCRSSAVLCTATQPALAEVEKRIVLSADHALASLSEEDKRPFKRVRFVNDVEHPKTTDEVAAFACGFLEQGKSVLVVLNTKATALAVYNSCRVPPGVEKLYLTTDLCSQHRKDNIERIRKNIERARKNIDGETHKTTLCVSTQLIEAGVDLSFDVVIRANAGVDSIIQAGGRCNRHGEYAECQPVYIVEIAGENLARLQGIELAKNATRRALAAFPEAELSDACVLERFYSYLFDSQRNEMGYPIKKSKIGGTVYEMLDKNERARSLYKELKAGNGYGGCPAAFAAAAENFRMIEGEQIAAVVPYEPDREKIMGLVSEFEKTFETKDRMRILRVLQPYTVTLFAYRESWLQTKAEKVRDVFYLLGEGAYNSETGLAGEGYDPMI